MARIKIDSVVSPLLETELTNLAKDIKKENVEVVSSLIADFCSSWELFKCKSIPYINLEIDLVNTCREIHSLVSKNEDNFQKNDVGDSIKDVCEALAFQSIFVIFGFMRYLRRVFIKNSFTNPLIEILSKI